MSGLSHPPATEPFLVASEVLPPPGRSDAAGADAIRAHQERATQLARAHGGAILVRVGRGCVARFDTAEAALMMAARLVHPRRRSAPGRPVPVRVALHLARLSEHPTPLADPAVARVRRLLDGAGPGEILVSDPLYQTLPEPRPPATATGRSSGGADAEGRPPPPAAHRLLYLPEPAAAATRSPLRSGWIVGGAAVFVVLLCVSLLALSFLS